MLLVGNREDGERFCAMGVLRFNLCKEMASTEESADLVWLREISGLTTHAPLCPLVASDGLTPGVRRPRWYIGTNIPTSVWAVSMLCVRHAPICRAGFLTSPSGLFGSRFRPVPQSREGGSFDPATVGHCPSTLPFGHEPFDPLRAVSLPAVLCGGLIEPLKADRDSTGRRRCGSTGATARRELGT